MAAAHTDYPCMRIKPNPDFHTEAYAQVNVEVYGGPILNTWFDRPLGVAGRVVLRSEDVFAPRTVLYHSQKAVLTIPNLAIHMNREVNKGCLLYTSIRRSGTERNQRGDRIGCQQCRWWISVYLPQREPG